MQGFDGQANIGWTLMGRIEGMGDACGRIELEERSNMTLELYKHQICSGKDRRKIVLRLRSVGLGR